MSLGSLLSVPAVIARTTLTYGLVVPTYLAKTAVSLSQGMLNITGNIGSIIVPPIVSLAGATLENFPGLASAGVFGTIGYFGGKKVAKVVPFISDCKWITVDSRFKKRFEMKAKPINLTELVNKNAALTTLSDMTMDGANKIAEERTTAATTAKTAADNARLALKTLEDAQEELDAAQENLAEATTNPNTKGSANYLALLQNFLDEAKVAKVNAESNPLLATAKDLISKSDEAEKASALAAERLKELKKMKEPLKAGEKPPADTHMMTFTVEEVKPKTGEWRLNIPLSDETLVYSHDDMKKELGSAAAGVAMLGVGFLGVLDSAGGSVSYNIVGRGWSWVGFGIGAPVHLVTNFVGGILGWAAQNDTYGLGKLTTAGLLTLGSYCALQKTKLVWFNIAKDKASPLIKKDVIKKDLCWLTASAVALTAGIITANEFIKGN